MEDFLTFVILVILGFYVVGWVGRLLFRRWLLKKQREINERFGQNHYGQNHYGQNHHGQNSSGQERRREGEVIVQQTAAPHKKTNRNVGDYVEYEEVEVTEEVCEE